MMKTLLIVDGNSILNRAFFGIRPLTTKDGLFTHAVYGMMNILLRHLDAVKPTYAAVAFDLHAPTFRHQMYDGYKATRKGMPPELAVQLPYAKQCCEALGFHLLSLEGYEADDILGTCARLADENGDCAKILTGDRDSLQLIRDHVTVLLASTGETTECDRTEFAARYAGLRPEQFVDVKALMGDSSDNIPGVPGIGEKTACRLIADHGSLEDLYRHLPEAELTPSVRKKLTEGEESARLSQTLARIETHVPLGITLDDLSYAGPDRPRLLSLCTELELTGMIKRLGLENAASEKENAAKTPTASEEDTASSDTPEASAEKEESATYQAEIPSSDADTADETSTAATEAPLSPFEILPLSDAVNRLAKDAIIGAAVTSKGLRLSGQSGRFLCPQENEADLAPKALADRILSLPVGTILATADSKALYARLGSHIDALTDRIFDASLAGYVLDTNAHSYDLPRLAVAYLGRVPTEEEDDADLLLALTPVLKRELEKSGQIRLYEEIERPLAGVLSAMEEIGFWVDRQGLTDFGAMLSEAEQQHAQAVYGYAGMTFNLNSPRQLSEVLYDRLGLPGGKKTKTGRSTDAETLERLLPYHPVIGELLEYRQVAKLRATYADGLLKAADDSGRIHTSFRQTVTATGRLSSVEPNLQNIPIRTELGREMRRFFRASDENHVLIDADYSQIELRLLAAISEDEKMIAAFSGGRDIHTETAASVFGVNREDVTPEMRKRAKAVNFGILYGMSDFSLAQDIGVTKKQAAVYIENYKAQFPKVQAYLEQTIASARQNGYVTTIFGRRRYIPELASPKKMMQAFGERVAMNSPIQGAAADIIKKAMIGVSRTLADRGLDARLILQVHDELILESARGCAEEAAVLLREQMEGAVTLAVPLTVEVGIGDTWFDCHS